MIFTQMYFNYDSYWTTPQVALTFIIVYPIWLCSKPGKHKPDRTKAAMPARVYMLKLPLLLLLLTVIFGLLN